MLDSPSRMLPAFALYPATLLLFLALIYAISRTPFVSGKFLVAIVWLRYVMQAYHDYTHAPIVGSVSANALVSIMVCAVGAALLAGRARELMRFPLILLLLTIIVISALINGAYTPMFETLLKWGYLLVIILCIQDCIQRARNADILRHLLWAFAPPLLFQALSVVLGVAKATESDQSVSFIGGFQHEAAFSIILATCFAVTTLAPRVHPLLRAALLVLCIAGIFAANYRTTLLAMAPIAFGFLVFGAARLFTEGERPLVMTFTTVLALCVLGGAGWLLRERLADLALAFDSADLLAKLPTEFTQAESQLLSGRLYLWSQYLQAYAAGDDLQLLFGFGPDAWIGVFGHYAHNTLVSYLYEFGVFGAALIALIWIAMLARTRAIRDPWLRGQLQFAHLGFIVLNFATMPHWQIEGMIFYGVLCGYTHAVAAPKARRVLIPAYVADSNQTVSGVRA